MTLINCTWDVQQSTMRNGTYPLSMNSFLYRSSTTGKFVLFDSGIGTRIIPNLMSLGSAPADVDAIFLTHMHGDHIGGLLHDSKPLFPDRKVYVERREYAHRKNATWPTAVLKSVLAAYEKQFLLFDAVPEGVSIYPGIVAYDATGHTAGHTVYLVENTAVILGGLVIAADVQFPYPNVSLTWDEDRHRGIEKRVYALGKAVEHNLVVAGAHIPYPGIGRVVQAGEGFQFVPAAEELRQDL
jgi:glyoxylase-like metal-dependent hydrolase (beta-lactamase superfamily II)